VRKAVNQINMASSGAWRLLFWLSGCCDNMAKQTCNLCLDLL